ncbi:MAG: FAD-binding oxidoreductase [Rickettsiales bacterium]|nr:FAD-binding oxidoreductase [Rickettsiales bacterium]
MARYTNNQPNIAVVGGGISGMGSAWFLHKLNPSIAIDVFETTPAEAYKAGSDHGAHIASMGASGNRMIRQMGHDASERFVVSQTVGMIEELQQALDHDAQLPITEQRYRHLHQGMPGSRTLLTPRANLYVSEAGRGDGTYQKKLASLQEAGLHAQKGYLEISGKQAKRLFPGVCHGVSDQAAVLLENGYGAEKASVCGAMDTEAILQVAVGELEKNGARFHFATPVSHIADTADNRVVLQTMDGEQLHFSKAIVAPGAGLDRFVDGAKKTSAPASETDKHVGNLSYIRQRVLMADIDLPKLFNTRIDAFNGNLGVPLLTGDKLHSSYGWSSDSRDMHMKIYPASLRKDALSDKDLYAPLSTEEHQALAKSVMEQFGLTPQNTGLNEETLTQHVMGAISPQACFYVSPKGPKQQIVMPFHESSNITFNGLDAGGAWRLAGNGLNAAMQTLGMKPPAQAPDMFEKTSFEKHTQQSQPSEPETKVQSTQFQGVAALLDAIRGVKS